MTPHLRPIQHNGTMIAPRRSRTTRLAHVSSVGRRLDCHQYQGTLLWSVYCQTHNLIYPKFYPLNRTVELIVTTAILETEKGHVGQIEFIPEQKNNFLSNLRNLLVNLSFMWTELDNTLTCCPQNDAHNLILIFI